MANQGLVSVMRILLSAILVAMGSGCAADPNSVASRIERIRGVDDVRSLTLEYDSYSDPEYVRDSEIDRVMFVLSRVELRLRGHPDQLDRIRPGLFPSYHAHLRCILVLVHLGATEEGRNCYASLASKAVDRSDVASLVQETLQLRMAESLILKEPWRAHRILVLEHAKSQTPRTFRALLSFYVTTGEVSEAMRVVDELGAGFQGATIGALNAWRSELEKRVVPEGKATRCGQVEDWPCSPGFACDCSETIKDPLLYKICVGTCRPNR
jgi:hypothetical protein